MFVTPRGLSPTLGARAELPGARDIAGTVVVGDEQDADGVTATIRDCDSGDERRIRAKYLIGTDGAHSKVRELLGIEFDGRGVFSNAITIYFHAPLARYVVGRALSVIYVKNAELSGFFRMDKDGNSGFLVVNTVGDTSRPEAASPANDVRPERLIELVRLGAGVPELPVTIDGVARWRATSDVARRFQDGRVFLAGDAAHLMPPNGGYGGNTGIHDGHNLAWKLAMVLNGVAGPGLLSTYETERRPVGKFTVEQAYTRYVTRSATYLGARDFQPLANDFNIELGYIYRSPAIVAEDDVERGSEDPRESHARPGSRAPHLWLEKRSLSSTLGGGQRISTLDLFGRGFVLLTSSGGAAWADASRASAPEITGLDFDAHVIPSAEFATAYGIGDSGAVLVRPDGFVAWRAQTMAADPGRVVAKALETVLMRH
jgi:2-polyprenyl-6-methoxyphenol hydroxylase-like FAD-dependent oxidoreductase